MGDYPTTVNARLSQAMRANPYQPLSNFKTTAVTTGGILTPEGAGETQPKNTEVSEIEPAERAEAPTPITNQTMNMKELLASVLVSRVKELKANFMQENNEHIKQLQRMKSQGGECLSPTTPLTMKRRLSLSKIARKLRLQNKERNVSIENLLEGNSIEEQPQEHEQTKDH
jgi:hypothetical protein